MQQTTTTPDAVLVATPTDIPVSPEVFLRRLRRLLVLRYRASHYLDEGDVYLLDHCIYATYCDCRELGADETARRLLDEARAGKAGPTTA